MLFISGAPVQALTLMCEITSQSELGRTFSGRGISKKSIESWSPKKQTHVLNLKTETAVYKGTKLKAKIDTINDKVIKWKYVIKYTDENKTTFNAITFKYHYVRKNHKIITSVDFGPGYLKIESNGGSCTERK
jgi:hypothetical protein